MKRIFCIIFPCIFLMLSLCTAVNAEELSVSELAEDYGINDTADYLPENASSFLDQNGISPDDPGSMTGIRPSDVIAYMWKNLKSSAAAPLKLLGMIMSVIILSAVSAAAVDTVKGQNAYFIYRTVTVLVCVAIVVPFVDECMSYAQDTLISGGEFMLGYVPVFAGIAAASGCVTASASYSMIVLVTAEIAVQFVSEALMPVISVCMAMNIINAINPAFSLSSVTEVLKKWTSLLMGFVMTIFTGLLSFQSIVGTSADTVGAKAARFVVSNFVPVVGGAVADAYSTMKSGLGLLRGAAGAFGILSLALTLLPPVLHTVCLYIAMTAGEAVTDMFGARELSGFFRGTASVMSLITAVLSCFGVMFVISTVILMAAGLGTNMT